METKKSKKKILVLLGVTAALAVIAIVTAVVFFWGKNKEKEQEYRLIKVAAFSGRVMLTRNDKEDDVFEGMKLKSKDMITTHANASVELLVDSDKYIMAEENTCFSITSKGDKKNGKFTIKLEYGTTLVEIDNKLNEGSKFEVHTPNAITAVRGTTFNVTYDKEAHVTEVAVEKGMVEVSTDTETGMVEAGNTIFVQDNGTLTRERPDTFWDEGVTKGRWPIPEYTDEIAIYMSNVSMWELEKDFGVKQLKDWVLVRAESEDGIAFSREDVFLFYGIADEREYKEELGKTKSGASEYQAKYLTNKDGESVTMIARRSSAPDKIYQADYYLKREDGYYFHISIRDGSKESEDVVDYERYVALTSKCYFVWDVKKNGTEEAAAREVLAKEYMTLFRGEPNAIKLNFLLSVVQSSLTSGNTSYVKTALNKIYYNQNNPDCYSRVIRTDGGSDYEIAELNKLFSAITDDTINETNIPPISRIDEEYLVYQPCTATEAGSTTVTIEKVTLDEKAKLVVEYSFRTNYGSSGKTGETGTTKAYFKKASDGRYVLDYAEVVSKQRFEE